MRYVLLIFIAMFSLSVHAAFDPSQMVGFDPANPGDVRVKFNDDDQPKTIAEHGDFAVVNFAKTQKCPSGGYYLVNLNRKSYQFVDAGTCAADMQVTLTDPLDPKKSLATQVLTFRANGKISARYPLYGY